VAESRSRAQCRWLPTVVVLCAAVTGGPQRVSRAEDGPRPAIRYSGTARADTSADGGLPLASGTHNIQVVRSNRSVPYHADGLADTYLHAPMLAYWHGRFYLEYLSGPRGEHEAPCPTSLTSSSDGVSWERPRIVFPAIALPDGTQSITHQRMGFYVAPNGRLLALAFHGKAPNPPDGSGVGRVVREVRDDRTFGPIHFIRCNRHAGWNESNTPYPYFTASDDPGFVEACRALLANRLVTQQWWEEDRSQDGFYTATGRALSFYHRRDGAAVGLWKEALTALSTDEGESWTPQTHAGNVPSNGSKYWGQRTADGRYAIFFNPTARLRHPLAVMSGEDGEVFDDLLTVHGEVPDQRFAGRYKNLGPQYVRGIVEGNGTPPGDAVWVAYSVNKEDIWVSRVPVPIRGDVDGPVADGFDSLPLGSLPPAWNVYSPTWAPVRVVQVPGAAGHVLELRDEEPYDYARAQRVFAAGRSVRVRFRLLARQTTAPLEIEVLGAHGERSVRLALTTAGRIRACHEGIWQDAGSYLAERWMTFELDINPGKNVDRFELRVDGRSVLERPGVFTDPAAALARLSFRTGPYRQRGSGGEDLPGADQRAPLAVFWVDDVAIDPGVPDPQP
jgi:hypothetical protein